MLLCKTYSLGDTIDLLWTPLCAFVSIVCHKRVLLEGEKKTCSFCVTKGQLTEKKIYFFNLLIWNVRTCIDLLFGDPTQTFLWRLSYRADAEKRGLSVYGFKNQSSFSNLWISVERNDLLSRPFILPHVKLHLNCGVSVNHLLVWVCLQEARCFCNFDSPSEKHILISQRTLNVTGKGFSVLLHLLCEKKRATAGTS